jgi:LmbE family N-acetylglucosaminyl deacetylase
MIGIPSLVGRATNILVVVAHPDDEVLGCGAAIARFAEEGHNVRVLLALRRSCSDRIPPWDAMVAAFQKCCAILGAEGVLADPLLDENEAERSIRNLENAILPHIEWCDTVMTHWIGDVHQAHRAVARAVEVATRPFRRRKHVLSFEIPTSTDQTFGATFAATAYIIAEERHVRLKQEAFRSYFSEFAPGRTPESLLRRLEMRGEEIGTSFAEAFVVGRMFI